MSIFSQDLQEILLTALRMPEYKNEFIQVVETLRSDVDAMEISGTDKQVQFNDGGVFGSDANLVFDKITKSLIIGAGSETNSFASGQLTTDIDVNSDDTKDHEISVITDTASFSIYVDGSGSPSPNELFVGSKTAGNIFNLMAGAGFNAARFNSDGTASFGRISGSQAPTQDIFTIKSNNEGQRPLVINDSTNGDYLTVETTGETNVNGYRITNLGSPTAASDAVTKSYVGGISGKFAPYWVEGVSAPSINLEYDAKAAFFVLGGGEDLFTVVRVPIGYAGGQIYLRTFQYSPDSSGTILMKTEATLIRSGTDVFNSTTNQRTSTNNTITLTGGSVDEPAFINFDLTDSNSQINGVTVGQGDQIKVRLYRDTDTATSDARIQIYQTEITFG